MPHFVFISDSSGGGGGGSAINGLHIEIPREVSWQGFKDFAITVGVSTSDIMTGLTRSTTNPITGFGDLSAGEYGTDSTYNTADDEWNDAAWDDGSNTANSASGNIHWTNSGSVGMNIWFKFASAVELRDVRALIWAPSSYTYDPANWIFKDDAGNTLSPTRPSSATDYEHEYDANNKSYQFTF